MPPNPTPPPAPRPLPPNFQEIADLQLQRTAPEALQEQNKENVQILTEDNRNKKQSQKDKSKSLPEKGASKDSEVSRISPSKCNDTNEKESMNNDIANTPEPETSTSTQLPENFISESNPEPEASNEVIPPTPSNESEIVKNPRNSEQIIIERNELLVEQTIIPIQNLEQIPEQHLESVQEPVPEQQNGGDENQQPLFNIDINTLPIVVEIPIIPKIEKDAEIGDIVSVPKLIELEKLTIKQEKPSPVHELPNPFDSEIIKENVMVQIPRNLVSMLEQKQEPISPPHEEKKPRRCRRRKTPEPQTEQTEPESVTNKRKSDTQIQKPTKSKKKKTENDVSVTSKKADNDVAVTTKKTRTKKGRSKSLHELSSSSKHIRVKSPLELNDILKAKYNDIPVSKTIGKKIILGLKKGISAASAEKH